MGFRYTQKRKGGAFVAKGSYGCVFKKPPLKCLANATRKNNSYISKLSKRKTADEEYAQSLIIRHYDPKEEYFVTAESECDLNSTNVKPENEINKCDLNVIKTAVRNNNYTSTALVMYKNAGTDLHRLTLAVEDYIPFYESFINIFNAVKFIHSKGIIHRDLKSDNLISQKNPDGTFTTRLIDVGFMCPLKPLQNDPPEGLIELQNEFLKGCDFWYGNKKGRSYGPFYEYMFGEPSKKRKASRIQEYEEGKDFRKAYVNWVDSISSHLGTDDPFKNEDGTPAHAYEDVMNTLVEVWGENKLKRFSTLTDAEFTGPEFVLEMASKADVFSLGLIISKLQKRYVHHSVEKKHGALKVRVERSTKLKNAGAPDIWVPVEDLSRFGVPDDITEWHIAVANRISIPLHILMVRMSDLDPRRALDLNDALREYSEILTAVRELYTPSNIYKGLKAIDDFPQLVAPGARASKTTSSKKPGAAAATSASTSSSTKARKPTSSKPTSTRKLKMDEATQKALSKKKRALQLAKEEAEEEIEDAEADLLRYRKDLRAQDDKLDKARRDKLKDISKFEKAVAKYAELVKATEKRILEAHEEGRERIQAAQEAYNAFRAAIPRRTASK